MLLDTYVITLMKSVISGPFKMAFILAPYILIPNGLIHLIEANLLATLAETEATLAQQK